MKPIQGNMAHFPSKKDASSVNDSSSLVLSTNASVLSGISDARTDPMWKALETAADAARAELDNGGTKKSALKVAKEIVRSNLLAGKEKSKKSSLGRMVHGTKLTKKVNKLAKSAVDIAQNVAIRDAKSVKTDVEEERDAPSVIEFPLDLIEPDESLEETVKTDETVETREEVTEEHRDDGSSLRKFTCNVSGAIENLRGSVKTCTNDWKGDVYCGMNPLPKKHKQGLCSGTSEELKDTLKAIDLQLSKTEKQKEVGGEKSAPTLGSFAHDIAESIAPAVNPVVSCASSFKDDGLYYIDRAILDDGNAMVYQEWCTAPNDGTLDCKNFSAHKEDADVFSRRAIPAKEKSSTLIPKEKIDASEERIDFSRNLDSLTFQRDLSLNTSRDIGSLVSSASADTEEASSLESHSVSEDDTLTDSDSENEILSFSGSEEETVHSMESSVDEKVWLQAVPEEEGEYEDEGKEAEAAIYSKIKEWEQEESIMDCREEVSDGEEPGRQSFEEETPDEEGVEVRLNPEEEEISRGIEILLSIEELGEISDGEETVKWSNEQEDTANHSDDDDDDFDDVEESVMDAIEEDEDAVMISNEEEEQQEEGTIIESNEEEEQQRQEILTGQNKEEHQQEETVINLNKEEEVETPSFEENIVISSSKEEEEIATSSFKEEIVISSSKVEGEKEVETSSLEEEIVMSSSEDEKEEVVEIASFEEEIVMSSSEEEEENKEGKVKNKEEEAPWLKDMEKENFHAILLKKRTMTY
mmetsp:Transcript_28776/g.42001  ORF Transcript_28776/g.42001 Transcript_28776/m.42001 type:complete len:755 (+) Transcript_28776:27-2291(+)